MAELIIDNDVAERLRHIAEAENRPIDAVLRSALDSYAASLSPEVNETENEVPQASVYEVWAPQISPEGAHQLLKMLEEDKITVTAS